ncbi:MAG: four helix bundle protein [Gemmataceae bacterium]
MAARTFTELLIWQRARQWSKAIHLLTRRSAFKADRRLVIQINDSSASVMANIAEGFGRGTQGEFVQFLGYALGSLNETQSHLTAAYDREYVTRDEYAELFQVGTEIRKMTVGFVNAMVMDGSGVKNVRKRVNWSEKVWETYERITGKPRPERFRTSKPAAEVSS